MENSGIDESQSMSVASSVSYSSCSPILVEDFKIDAMSMQLLDGSNLVGIHNLPDQYIQKTLKKDFIFNILVVGESGIGKSTLIDSLFDSCFCDYDDVSTEDTTSSISLQIRKHKVSENGVRVQLTVVEVHGYGDQINCDGSHEKVVEYINEQFEAYFQEEMKLKRDSVNTKDTRIHCCLFLLSPLSYRLKPLDVVTMLCLHRKVNLIPVIAKSDALTTQELEELKASIMSDIHYHKIEVYRFPTDDTTVVLFNETVNQQTPLAVVASNDIVSIEGRRKRVRTYPWGTVEIENDYHSESLILREAILRINLIDLRDVTHSKHYELYRGERLVDLGLVDENFTKAMLELRRAHLDEMARKEQEVTAEIFSRINQKEDELCLFEEQLNIQHNEFIAKCVEEQKEIDEEFRMLSDEIQEFRNYQVLTAKAKLTKSPSMFSVRLQKLKKKF